MRLVMLGPPAAGKGTQGKLLASKYGVPHISTGSLFRASMLAENELGRQVSQCIERGELVPDQIATAVVKMRLTQSDCQDGFVLDGFPRTVTQAENLDEALGELGIGLNAVISIEIPEMESVRRIANRRICKECGSSTQVTSPSENDVCRVCAGQLIQRPDDTLEAARTRLAVHTRQTVPLIAYYKLEGRIISVNGEQPVDTVYAHIVAQLAKADFSIDRGKSVNGVAK